MLMLFTRRLGWFVVGLPVVSLVVFWTTSVLPGDPAAVILGTSASPESLAALRTEMGLDRSLWAQFWDWFGGLLVGDLGTSHLWGLEVRDVVWERLQVTIPLAAGGMLISVLVAIPLGVWAATRSNGLTDILISVGSQIGLAIPAFWAGLMLISWLAVGWGWFPAGGFPGWQDIGGSLHSLLLPSLSLGLVGAAILIRYIRAAVIEVRHQDYIRTAQTKGMSLQAALWRHGLRNASLPLVAVAGLQLGALLAGAVVVEQVFVLPGLGDLLLAAILGRDLVLVGGAALTITVLILTINLAVDLVYPLLDPRLRRS